MDSFKLKIHQNRPPSWLGRGTPLPIPLPSTPGLISLLHFEKLAYLHIIASQHVFQYIPFTLIRILYENELNVNYTSSLFAESLVYLFTSLYERKPTS